MKKTRLYVGITLIVQAISFVFMFILLCAKKKSIAAAFLAVATMEGCAGAYLLWQYKQDLNEIDDGFGGGKVQLAVQKRALGELPAPRQTRSGGETRLKNTARRNASAVPLKLDNIFTCI